MLVMRKAYILYIYLRLNSDTKTVLYDYIYAHVDAEPNSK